MAAGTTPTMKHRARNGDVETGSGPPDRVFGRLDALSTTGTRRRSLKSGECVQCTDGLSRPKLVFVKHATATVCFPSIILMADQIIIDRCTGSDACLRLCSNSVLGLSTWWFILALYYLMSCGRVFSIQ
jgi:hypothetical protein